VAIGQSLLPEFDQEMASTRKLLERLPEQISSWKPHEKSMPFDRLACHVVELPQWATETINRTELDITPPSDFNPEDFVCHTRKSALEKFEASANKARAAIAGASDEQLAQNWMLKRGEQTLMSLPRAVVLRSFVMNHLIHHRAQLGVYMRLQNIEIPGMYGPSADEKGSFGAVK
jgi:uncharacterized damage-inducible protein DinB